ncbi:hypothetical protein [Streptomyces sp. NPDC048650]|uniref:hypothetical protein n=1 Tax=Streptomyces sp. NPDC048650 TaxID=3365583 RepID=UPI003712995E
MGSPLWRRPAATHARGRSTPAGSPIRLYAGDKALSYEQDAAIRIPCSLPDSASRTHSAKPGTTFLTVQAHASGPAAEGNAQRREDLAYLASHLAGHAHFAMGCKEPLNVPDGEPKITHAG